MDRVNTNVLDMTKDVILTCTNTEVGAISARLERVRDKVGSVDSSIAERVHANGLLAQRDAIAHSNGNKQEAHDSALRSFLAGAREMEMGAESESEDGKVPSALDAAIRKIKNGLERDADLAVESTCSRVANATAKDTKVKEKEAKDKAFREECIAKGIDPDTTGPSGAIDGGKGTVELTGVELALAAILPKLDELNAIDPDRVGDMIVGFESRVDKALSEMKGKIGERIAS